MYLYAIVAFSKFDATTHSCLLILFICPASTNTCPPPPKVLERQGWSILMLMRNHRTVPIMTGPRYRLVIPTRLRVGCKIYIVWPSLTIHTIVMAQQRPTSSTITRSGYPGVRGELGACVETRVDTSISANELASWTSHRQATVNTRQR